jgi:hypothetical protein
MRGSVRQYRRGPQGLSGSGPQVRLVLDAVNQTTVVQVRLDGSVVNDMAILVNDEMTLAAANLIP